MLVTMVSLISDKTCCKYTASDDDWSSEAMQGRREYTSNAASILDCLKHGFKIVMLSREQNEMSGSVRWSPSGWLLHWGLPLLVLRAEISSWEFQATWIRSLLLVMGLKDSYCTSFDIWEKNNKKKQDTPTFIDIWILPSSYFPQ